MNAVRPIAWLLWLGVAWATSACTEDVQLAHVRKAVVIPPKPSGATSPDVTRAEYCDGRGSPVAAQLLAAPGQTSNDSCLEPAPRVFRYALCSCEDTAFTGAFTADAFDSSVAAHTPGKSGASIGVNGQLTTTGNVDILGSLVTTGIGPLAIAAAGFHVAGTLQANADLTLLGQDASIGRDLWVNGDIFAPAANVRVAGDVHQPAGHTGADTLIVGGRTLSEDFELQRPCACGADELLDIAAIVAHGLARNDNAELGIAADALYRTTEAALELECGRVAFDSGEIAGESRVTARGRSALFIRGDLAISGTFAPDLGSSGEMDVFVQGDLILGLNASIGTSARPAALRLYVGGASDITLIGSGTFAAGLYAPQASLYIAGNRTLHGAMFVASFYPAGAQVFHYDSALLASHNEPQACSDPTPDDGCRTDAECVLPFVCRNATCVTGLD